MGKKELILCDFCRREVKNNYATIKISFSDDNEKSFFDKEGDKDLAIFCPECVYNLTTFMKNMVNK